MIPPGGGWTGTTARSRKANALWADGRPIIPASAKTVSLRALVTECVDQLHRRPDFRNGRSVTRAGDGECGRRGEERRQVERERDRHGGLQLERGRRAYRVYEGQAAGWLEHYAPACKALPRSRRGNAWRRTIGRCAGHRPRIRSNSPARRDSPGAPCSISAGSRDVGSPGECPHWFSNPPGSLTASSTIVVTKCCVPCLMGLLRFWRSNSQNAGRSLTQARSSRCASLDQRSTQLRR